MRSRFKTVLLFSEKASTKGGDYTANSLGFKRKAETGGVLISFPLCYLRALCVTNRQLLVFLARFSGTWTKVVGDLINTVASARCPRSAQ